MMTIQNYRKAESLEEAWELNQKRSSCVIAGMLWTKMGKRMVGTAIDISGLGLDYIEEDTEEFRIGAMTSLRSLEKDPGMEAYSQGTVREALSPIVGVQFRNLATVGGSLYGRYGFSDVLTVFLMMDSYVDLYKEGRVPLEEYAARKKYERDILVQLVVKKHEDSFCYQSVRNAATDFPVLTCGAALNGQGEYRFAIGARPYRAAVKTWKPESTEEKSAAEAAAEYTVREFSAGSNMRGSKEYRSHLIKVLTARAVERLGGAADAR